MHIIINDQPMEFDAPLTVNQLFSTLDRPMVGTALAINQVIIPKSQWDSYLINDQDNILLFQAIAGANDVKNRRFYFSLTPIYWNR